MSEEIKRRGRPTKAPVEGERVPLSLRVTAELKRDLDRSAEAVGRSLSQEAEIRLERSFADEAAFADPKLRFWAYRMVGVFHQAGAFEAQMKRLNASTWMDDPDCYQAAMLAVMNDLFQAQPDATPDRVALQIEALKSRLLTRVANSKGDDHAR